MPTLTIFAGCNGVGKTSIYNHYISLNKNENLGIRINPDEILQDFKGNWKNTSHILKSASITVEKLNYCLDNNLSFNWETTLISGLTINYIQKAKQLNYTINLCFVSVENVNIALNRIEQRIKKGGHGIDPQITTARFKRQFQNIQKIFPHLNNALFYDNTHSPQIVATYKNGKQTYKNNQIKWLENIDFPTTSIVEL